MPGSSSRAGAKRDDLLERRVLDQDDRPIARLAPPAIDGLAHLGFVSPGCRRQEVQRLVDVARLLAVERDVERVLVLDEHLPVAVEQHASRRREWQPAAVVVVRHLVELLMLRDLKHPEGHRQRRKYGRHDDLQRRQPEAQVAAIVDWEVGVGRHFRVPNSAVY